MAQTAQGKVRRDFFAWTTQADSVVPIHIKTNIPVQSGVMYRLVVEGYAHAAASPIYSEAVGYTSVLFPCLTTDKVVDHDPEGATLSQYCSSDGYVVLKLQAANTYYLGFGVSAWFVNPVGTFDISAAAYQQQANL